MLKQRLDFFITFVYLFDLRFQKSLIVEVKILENQSLFAGMDHTLLKQGLGKFGLIIT